MSEGEARLSRKEVRNAKVSHSSKIIPRHTRGVVAVGNGTALAMNERSISLPITQHRKQKLMWVSKVPGPLKIEDTCMFGTCSV